MLKKETKPLPLLPLRDLVVFPGMVIPLFVGREKSILALEQALKEEKKILLTAQKNPKISEPEEKDLYITGVLANILQMLKLPDGTVKILAEGIQTVNISKIQNKEYITADYKLIEKTKEDETKLKVLMKSAVKSFEIYSKFNRKGTTDDVLKNINDIEKPGILIDVLISNLHIKLQEKQELLEMPSQTQRLEKLYSIIENEIEFVKVDKRIKQRVKQQMEKNQRDFYLNEQIKAIQKELGEDEDEIAELEKKIKKSGMSKEALEKAKKEISKLNKMSPMSAEATVIRNYLDWLISIPWKKEKTKDIKIKDAKKILDDDHYSLEKVKERILEHLALQKVSNASKGTIICLYGPPGVGKTSLGKSIAKATGRKFVRTSLGGIRDEAEIRGHRRTYIGSQPGRIIQSMKKSGSNNPLMMLDEIDKLSTDWHGDPASALLEVLDPEQNKNFNDHYLEIDYDLSNVMFMATANSLKIPRPLLDRMELINISGYTEDEKIEISKQHLIPKQLKEHSLTKDNWEIQEEAVRDVIRYYTKETGVRNLEREIAKIMRKAVKKMVELEENNKTSKPKKITITPENIKEYLGVKKFRFGTAGEKDLIGVTTGLAWTEVGGEILSIEALSMQGKGKFTLTGQLGSVMKESIEAAKSFVRSNSENFGIDPEKFTNTDMHVHVPEGAVPKDGPSAGVAMCTSIVSVLTGIPVRKDIAMTGEITLQGRVLPIGGLKEKLLAALRAGIKEVLIPIDNKKNLVEIPDKVKKNLKIHTVESAKEVLEHALVKPLKPIKKKEAVQKTKEEDRPHII